MPYRVAEASLSPEASSALIRRGSPSYSAISSGLPSVASTTGAGARLMPARAGRPAIREVGAGVKVGELLSIAVQFAICFAVLPETRLSIERGRPHRARRRGMGHRNRGDVGWRGVR